MKVIFSDIQQKMIDAWQSQHAHWTAGERGLPYDVHIEKSVGSMLNEIPDITAVVSPANSFGFMTGGFDLYLSQFFGWSLQEKVQRIIHQSHDGELLVGKAFAVQTGHDTVPWVIVAPTMRVPSTLPEDTVAPYLATRAALRLAEEFEFESVAFSGMGTGAGRVAPELCALQMFRAMFEVEKKPIYKTGRDMLWDHQKLLGWK